MARLFAGLLAASLLWAVPSLAADDISAAAAAAAKELSTGGTKAPTLVEIESMEAALATAWEKTPLTQRNVVFVDKKPEMYGAYEARPTKIFARGEPLVTYLEPVGYTWTRGPDGTFRFGFTLDFKLKRPDGKILGGQDAFQTFDFSGHYRSREVFMNLTLTLKGVDPGDYVVVYTLHDKSSSKVSSFEQPFTIKG